MGAEGKAIHKPVVWEEKYAFYTAKQKRTKMGAEGKSTKQTRRLRGEIRIAHNKTKVYNNMGAEGKSTTQTCCLRGEVCVVHSKAKAYK